MCKHILKKRGDTLGDKTGTHEKKAEGTQWVLLELAMLVEGREWEWWEGL